MEREREDEDDEYDEDVIDEGDEDDATEGGGGHDSPAPGGSKGERWDPSVSLPVSQRSSHPSPSTSAAIVPPSRSSPAFSLPTPAPALPLPPPPAPPPSGPPRIHLEVRYLERKLFTVKSLASCTAGKLLKNVCKHLGIKVAGVGVFWDGVELWKAWHLEDFELRNGMVLDVVPKSLSSQWPRASQANSGQDVALATNGSKALDSPPPPSDATSLPSSSIISSTPLRPPSPVPTPPIVQEPGVDLLVSEHSTSFGEEEPKRPDVRMRGKTTTHLGKVLDLWLNMHKIASEERSRFTSCTMGT